MKFFKPIYLLLAFTIFCLGCSDSKEVRYISYAFKDAAKAPEYRRDYTIHIAPLKATAEITNGDSLLAVGHFTMYPGQFDTLQKVSATLNGLDRTYTRQDCGGCNWQSLRLMDSTRHVIKRVDWNGGHAPTELLLFKELMMEQVGNFNILLQSTRQKSKNTEAPAQ